MKKLFFLFAFLGLATVGVNAQSCSKAKTASSEKSACCIKAAAKAASLDADIESRICSKSGKVSYVKKSVCSRSGSVSYADVEYDTKAAKFVNVSPSASAMPAAKAGAKKSCDPAACMKAGAKKASAKKVCDPANCNPANCNPANCKKSKAGATKVKLINQ